jgi:hypothetical protein
MPKGEFNQAQKAHIESFMPEFVTAMDGGSSGMELTHWKQRMASNILDSPLFSALDLVKFPRHIWFEASRCFTAFRG